MMGIFFQYIIWSWLLAVVAAPDHALYLAVVQLDHSETQAPARITIKVFEDDLRDAIRAAFPGEYQVGPIASFCNIHARPIERYFRQHLQCAINGDPAVPEFRSGKLAQDVYLLEFVLPCPERWTRVQLQADFFMELFPTQSNVLHLLHGSDKRFGRLTKGLATVIFEW